MDAKLKHLEFIETIIGRMAGNSFLFKGWAITIASALATFAAVDSTAGLLAISLVSSLMFWGLDGYYLWLERCFRSLYATVRETAEDHIDFSMNIDKSRAPQEWFKACVRPHLVVFYGSIIAVEVVGIFVIKGK